MKIKLNSHAEFSLKKPIETLSMTIVVRAVIHENNKYYLQVFAGECLFLIMKNIKILFFDRIGVSQETDVNKTKCFKRVWYLPQLVFLK